MGTTKHTTPPPPHHKKSWDLVNLVKIPKEDNQKNKCRENPSKPTRKKPPSPKNPKNPKRRSSKNKISKFPKLRRKREEKEESPKLSKKDANTSKGDSIENNSNNRKISVSESLWKVNGSRTSISRRISAIGMMRKSKMNHLMRMKDLNMAKDTICDLKKIDNSCLYF